MIVVPVCLSCGSSLEALNEEEAKADVRSLFRVAGVEDRAQRRLAVATEELVQRLRCTRCEDRYVLATEGSFSITCECGGSMRRSSTTHGRLRWPETEWICLSCECSYTVYDMFAATMIGIWRSDVARGGARTDPVLVQRTR